MGMCQCLGGHKGCEPDDNFQPCLAGNTVIQGKGTGMGADKSLQLKQGLPCMADRLPFIPYLKQRDRLQTACLIEPQGLVITATKGVSACRALKRQHDASPR